MVGSCGSPTGDGEVLTGREYGHRGGSGINFTERETRRVSCGVASG